MRYNDYDRRRRGLSAVTAKTNSGLSFRGATIKRLKTLSRKFTLYQERDRLLSVLIVRYCDPKKIKT